MEKTISTDNDKGSSPIVNFSQDKEPSAENSNSIEENILVGGSKLDERVDYSLGKGLDQSCRVRILKSLLPQKI